MEPPKLAAAAKTAPAETEYNLHARAPRHRGKERARAYAMLAPRNPEPAFTNAQLVRRGAELVALYGVLPVMLFLFPVPAALIPGLVVGGGICLMMLLRDQTFDRRLLWNREGAAREIRSILKLWAVALVIGAILVATLAPEIFLNLPRQRPLLWLAIMFTYPIASVYPQELIYRAFFMHRYQCIFGTGAWMVVASGLAFGFGHIFFQAPAIAVSLSTLGGLIIAARYRRSRSLLAAAAEHALYGLMVFTLGLGQYFYLGAR